MNRYKILFEKTYSDRCISKKAEQEIIIESELDLNKTEELSQLGFNKLIFDCPEFFQNFSHKSINGWSEPVIKNIVMIP